MSNKQFKLCVPRRFLCYDSLNYGRKMVETNTILDKSNLKNYKLFLSPITSSTIMGEEISVIASVLFNEAPVEGVSVKILDANEQVVLAMGKTDKTGRVVLRVRVDKPELNIEGIAILEDET